MNFFDRKLHQEMVKQTLKKLRMKAILSFCLFLSEAPDICSQPYQADTVLLLMGSRYEFSAIHDDKAIAEKAVVAGIEEVRRIEELISSWKTTSQTSAINRKAGLEPVKIDKELFDLIVRCKKVSELTEGAFDVSFAPLGNVWDVKKKMASLPSPSVIDSAKRLVGYKNIVLNSGNQTVFLSKKGMKISFGAIGKGYSANRAKYAMRAMGIQNGLVNAGGDLTAWGHQLKGDPWKIGIADPEKKAEYVAWLEAMNVSIVTSGNYEKYFEINGLNYSHIINPRTGYPSQGIKSVTVICPDAEFSDALATALFVMDCEKGISLVNRLKNVECLIIDSHSKLWQSHNLNLSYY